MSNAQRDTFTDYRERPAVNWSRLKVIGTSPLLYRYRLDHPRPDTPALHIGRAIHAAVLEPDDFDSMYAVYEGKVRRGKAWDAFCEANADREILRAADLEMVESVRDAVFGNHAAWPMLCNPAAQTETSLYWEEDGRAMKARADLLIDNGDDVLVVDLKTTRDVDPDAFGRDAARYGYHGQLAHYCAGAQAVYGKPARAAILAVEKDAPHDVGLFYLDDLALEAGRAMRADLLARLAECERTGNWPGKVPQPMPLQLPAWALPDDNPDDFIFEEA